MEKKNVRVYAVSQRTNVQGANRRYPGHRTASHCGVAQNVVATLRPATISEKNKAHLVCCIAAYTGRTLGSTVEKMMKPLKGAFYSAAPVHSPLSVPCGHSHLQSNHAIGTVLLPKQLWLRLFVAALQLFLPMTLLFVAAFLRTVIFRYRLVVVPRLAAWLHQRLQKHQEQNP